MAARPDSVAPRIRPKEELGVPPDVSEGSRCRRDCYSSRILFPIHPERQGAALVIAHPGHELRVHGWLERERPIVFVLTDGSGRGLSRLDSTSRLLASAGAAPGSIYGRFSDRALYDALLARELTLFVSLAAELTEALRAAAVATVAGDALEGFNPTHDLCRLLIDAAVLRLRRGGTEAAARTIANLQFPLEAHPESGSEDAAEGLSLDLDEAAFARKLAAARTYPEMAYEVDAAFSRFGPDAFRKERLTPAVSTPVDALYRETPYFERHGERRVAEGVYRTVLRGREHLAPVADSLHRWASE